MAHTYTSCYQVTVPPLDMDASAARGSGVRLRFDCESYAALPDFATLYLPAQMKAQAIEAERRAQGFGFTHAPGWVVSAEEDLAAHIAARNKMLAASSAPPVPSAASPEFAALLASDQLLNGSALTKSRHAIRREFHAIHGAGSSAGGGRGVIYGVRHQRGVHQTRKAQADGSLASAAAAAAAHLDRPAGQSLDGLMGGLPYFMRTEPVHASLPRSTTHASYTAIPRESSRMDQQLFHRAFEEPVPPTPALPRSHQQQSLPPATPTPRSLWDQSRVPRMPLLSSAQPNLFLLGSPDAAQASKSYPAWYRRSEILRTEAREAKEARREQRALQKQQGEESKEEQQPQPVFVPASLTMDRGSSSSRAHSSHGSRTARSHQPPVRPLFNPAAFAAAAAAAAAEPPAHERAQSLSARPSRPDRVAASASAVVACPTFQEHMQAARQRWAAQQQQQPQHHQQRQ